MTKQFPSSIGKKQKTRLSVYVMGGIGNQLFQYAAGYTLARRWGRELELDVRKARTQWSAEHPRSFLLDQFSLSCHKRTTALPFGVAASRSKLLRRSLAPLRRILSIALLDDDSPKCDSIILSANGPSAQFASLRGYWQKYRLVEECGEDLRREFRFRCEPEGQNAVLLQKITECEYSVSVHVRRGDYLKVNSSWVLTKSYYRRAIREIISRIREQRKENVTIDPQEKVRISFFIFSDDIVWCRQELPMIFSEFLEASESLSVHFVDHNNEARAVDDLRLMSSCKHHILALSSFSWWGAWLAGCDGQFVARPDSMETMEGMYPPHWIKISDN